MHEQGDQNDSEFQKLSITHHYLKKTFTIFLIKMSNYSPLYSTYLPILLTYLCPPETSIVSHSTLPSKFESLANFLKFKFCWYRKRPIYSEMEESDKCQGIDQLLQDMVPLILARQIWTHSSWGFTAPINYPNLQYNIKKGFILHPYCDCKFIQAHANTGK